MFASIRFSVGVFLVISCREISSSPGKQFYTNTTEFSDHKLMEPLSEENFDVTSCSGMSQTLHEGCSISDDCSTITCQMSFVDKPITLKLKVNNCNDPVTVTATMDISELDITWTHTFTGDDIIKVPGFTVSLPPILFAGVYVQVGLNKDGKNLHLAVNLLAKGEVLDKGFYRVNTTVMEGDLPIATNKCGTFKWWYNLSDLGKAFVICGPLLFIAMTVACCYCRCLRSNVKIFCCPRWKR